MRSLRLVDGLPLDSKARVGCLGRSLKSIVLRIVLRTVRVRIIVQGWIMKGFMNII